VGQSIGKKKVGQIAQQEGWGLDPAHSFEFAVTVESPVAIYVVYDCGFGLPLSI
jgi:hypothetical protein